MRPALLAAAVALLAPVTIALAATDAEEAAVRRGEIAYRKCFSCHAIEPGQALEGPSLRGIVGRRIASEPGFAYSTALQSLARQHSRWSEPLLARFIADAEQVAPRTKMNFHGIANPGERRDLILFLRRTGAR